MPLRTLSVLLPSLSFLLPFSFPFYFIFSFLFLFPVFSSSLPFLHPSLFPLLFSSPTYCFLFSSVSHLPLFHSLPPLFWAHLQFSCSVHFPCFSEAPPYTAATRVKFTSSGWGRGQLLGSFAPLPLCLVLKHSRNILAARIWHSLPPLPAVFFLGPSGYASGLCLESIS